MMTITVTLEVTRVSVLQLVALDFFAFIYFVLKGLPDSRSFGLRISLFLTSKPVTFAIILTVSRVTDLQMIIRQKLNHFCIAFNLIDTYAIRVIHVHLN